MRLVKLILIGCCALIVNMASAEPNDNSEYKLIDSKATPETKALYRNMAALAKNHVMFGHHDANAYGHSWKFERNRTDVKEVTGSNPAVYGHDFGGIARVGDPAKLKAEADSLRVKITEAYTNGGVNTMTWHFINPADNKSFYFKDSPIAALPMFLPGGKLHDKYREILGIIADFAKTCKGPNGELIPLIFRPYHEYDGEWFWWGVPYHATAEEFKGVWRFTVEYLRDSLNVHNFVYAISPDCRFKTEADFLSCYPGDEYVDMIGMDNYWDLRPDGGTEAEFTQKMKIFTKIAKDRKKLAAITETGREGIPIANWWTGTLLRLMQTDKFELSYVLVWRNAHDIKTHYYTPYPGHPSSEDFIKFRNDPYVLFEDDLPNMYK